MVVMQKGRAERVGSAASVPGNPQSAYMHTLLAAVPRVPAAEASDRVRNRRT